MPSYLRSSTLPTTIRTGLHPLKTVGFPAKSPVTGYSRPLSQTELWPLYNFEIHSRKCDACHDPYDVHKSGGKLCASGHALAQGVAQILYSSEDGAKLYSMRADERRAGQSVRVELPKGYPNVHGLVRAVERGVRHRRQAPVISYDRSYYVPARAVETPVVTYAGTTRRSSRKDSGQTQRQSSHRHSRHETATYNMRSVRDSLPELETDSDSSEDEEYVTKVNKGPQRRHSVYAAYNVDSRKPAKRHSRLSGYYV